MMQVGLYEKVGGSTPEVLRHFHFTERQGKWKELMKY
jgi:hypothetical protein